MIPAIPMNILIPTVMRENMNMIILMVAVTLMNIMCIRMTIPMRECMKLSTLSAVI